jgi:hypothetical protein
MCDPAPVDLRHHNALINMWNMLEAGSKPIRERIKDKADVRGYQVVRRISDIVGDWITLCDHMAAEEFDLSNAGFELGVERGFMVGDQT